MTRSLILGGTSDQRSTWPKVWPNFVLTQSFILEGGTSDQSSIWHSLTKCQCDPKPHLLGYIWPKFDLTKSLTKFHPDLKPHPGVTYDQRSTWPEVWPNVNLTQSLILLGTSDQSWTWPKSLTTFHPDLKPHPWEYIWPKFDLTKSLTKFHPDLKPHPGVTYDQRSTCPKSDQMLTWPKASSLGVIWPNISLTRRSGQPDLKYYHSWPQDVSGEGYIWPNVNLTWSLTKDQADP